MFWKGRDHEETGRGGAGPVAEVKVVNFGVVDVERGVDDTDETEDAFDAEETLIGKGAEENGGREGCCSCWVI